MGMNFHLTTASLSMRKSIVSFNLVGSGKIWVQVWIMSEAV